MHACTHTHTAYRTIMSFDRLVRSTLGLCDSCTPGDGCGGGHKLSTLHPPDTQIGLKMMCMEVKGWLV